jgi:two-component system chemotaxis response regulator CheB
VPTAGRDLVVVGASAGGVEALAELVAGLPADFPAAVLIVLHLMAEGRSMLPEILSRAGVLAAFSAEDGQEIVPSIVLVAPPDRHMLVQDGRVRVVHGPRENGHRPAIDPLFRSAARAAGPRAIGVVLSGLLDDGAAGLAYIKDGGGAAVVQDPEDALFADMPNAAIAATQVDCVVGIAGMSAALAKLVSEPAGEERRGAVEKPDQVQQDPTGLTLVDGPPTPLSCPTCGGALWEEFEGSVLRFRCQVGHAYSAQSMLSEQGSAVEVAMWAALRTLEERAELLHRMSRRQSGRSRARFQARAAEVEEHARRIREVLLDQGQLDRAEG